MCIKCGDLAVVLQNDCVAVTEVPASQLHDAIGGCVNRRAGWGDIVNARVVAGPGLIIGDGNANASDESDN